VPGRIVSLKQNFNVKLLILLIIHREIRAGNSRGNLRAMGRIGGVVGTGED
jgi:hypothetical protein